MWAWFLAGAVVGAVFTMVVTVWVLEGGNYDGN